jgi:hypothetical protein
MEDMYHVIETLPFELLFFEDDFLTIFDWAVTRINPNMRGMIRQQVHAMRVHPENRVAGG